MSIHAALEGIVSYREDYSLKNSSSRKEEISKQYNIFIKTLSEQLEGQSFADLTPSCPMSVRKIIVAQNNYKVAQKGYPNDQSVRGANCYYATIGGVFTMIARIIRVAVRSLGLLISSPVAAYQQHCYAPFMEKGSEFNIVKEDLRRVGWEWVDLGMTVASVVIGLVNTVAPNAISTDKMRDYYIDRMDDAHAKNKTFKEARDAYHRNRETIHQQWKSAQAVEVNS